MPGDSESMETLYKSTHVNKFLALAKAGRSPHLCLARAWTVWYGGWAATRSTRPPRAARSSSFCTCWCCLWSPSRPSSYRMVLLHFVISCVETCWQVWPWTAWWSTPPGSPPSGGRSGAPWRSRCSSKIFRRVQLTSSRKSLTHHINLSSFCPARRRELRWRSTSSSITPTPTSTCLRWWATTTASAYRRGSVRRTEPWRRVLTVDLIKTETLLFIFVCWLFQKA